MVSQNRIKELAAHFAADVIELRRRLHRNPELSWQEHETAALVASELRKPGIEVTEGVAQTGVVGLLHGGRGGNRCIALRADMDALPIIEQNDVPYVSQNSGVMHACGHDVHTASLLGVAKILYTLREEIPGTVKFIFQPSEEKIPSGAEAMIRAGVLANPEVHAILGLHVSPEFEAGTFGFCPGRFMASSDEIYLTVVGRGGHAAKPEELKNPLLISAEILMALKEISNPQLPVVLSFGKIEGKGATNIVPDKVEIAGTLRCFDESMRIRIHHQIAQVCTTIAEKYLGHCEVNILRGYPVLVNNDELTSQVQRLAAEYAGKEKAIRVPVRMGSEDFAYYTHHVPACFYRLGTGNKKAGITSGLHTPTFNIDERALEQSIGMMSWLALQLL